MMKVAVKFCGGCNPSYDRTDYWERIRAASNGRIEWVRLEDQDCRALLLICGCETACPLKETSAEICIRLVTDDTLPPDALVSSIEERCG